MFTIKEDTRHFKSEAVIIESYLIPGMVLLQVHTEEVDTGNKDRGHIRLSREQARQLGDALIRLADELFFREKQFQEELENEQE